MALTLQAMTLNCGNDAPGAKTVKEIVKSEADVLLLHCQEADFKRTREQLETALKNTKRQCRVIKQMVTHTKADTHLHHNTGIMILAICQEGISIKPQKNEEVRRDKYRWNKGYNKGGIYSQLEVTKENEAFTLDLTSAHLDAFSEATRAQDWAKLHRVQRLQPSDYQTLSRDLPDMLISGFDANTRNRLPAGGDENSKSTWASKPVAAMEGLVMAPMGNHRLSRASTYKTADPTILTTPDKRRPDYVKGGMLDLVSFNQREKAQALANNKPDYTLIAEATIFIPPEDESARDHAVIGSDIITLEKETPFEKTRTYLACSLAHAAPQIAAHILKDSFTESRDNEVYLHEVYHLYLSNKGLMQKRLDLHAQDMQFLVQAKQKASLKNYVFYEKELFSSSPWFLIPDGIEIDDITELKTQAEKHAVICSLHQLRQQFLAHSHTAEEKMNAIKIVNNAEKQIDSTEESRSIIDQTKKILQANSLIDRYAYHLSQENDKSVESKFSVIEELNKVLISEDPPKTIIASLESNLNEKTLSKHRDNDWLSRLFRSLKSIISGHEAKSQGQLFAEKFKVVLKDQGEEDNSEIEHHNPKY